MKRDLIIIIIMSIIIGVFYGKFVLGAVKPEDLINNPPTTDKEVADVENNQSTNNNTTSDIVLKEDECLVYLLQAGVFSKETTLKTYLSDYEAKSIPSITIKDNEKKDITRVYVGVIYDQTRLDKIKDIYLQKGIEIYVKKEILKKDNQFVLFMTNAEKLYSDIKTDTDIMNLQKLILNKYQELILGANVN